VLFEYLDNAVCKKILNIFRNQNGNNDAVFVFSLPVSKIPKLDQDIQNVLRSTPINLGLFEKNEAFDLITQLVKEHLVFTPQAMFHIYHRCGGFPNLLQAFCYQLIDFNNRTTRSSEINFEIVNQFERTNRVSFSDLISVFIQSLEDDQLKFLKILKRNGNRLDLQDIDSQIIKFDQFDNIEKVIQHLLRKKIIELNNNQYICVSEILIENV
jgi:hypothetical protein